MYIFILALIALIGFIFISVNLEYKLKKNHIVFIFIFMGIVSGIRYNVGLDYNTYEYLFTNEALKIFPESLFWLVNYISKEFFDEFFIVTLFMSIMTNYFIYRGLVCREIKLNYMLLSILIFTITIWLDSFNIMRQCLSVAIFFYASIFIKKRKFIPYAIYILIATGFHKSSIFLIGLYFIQYININRYLYIVLLLGSYMIVKLNLAKDILINISKNINGYEVYYLNNYIFGNSQNYVSYSLIIGILISVFIIFFCEDKIDKSNYLEKNYYIYGSIFSVLSISTYMYDRIGIYFQVFGIFVVPYVISNIKNTSARKLIYAIIVILVMSVYLNESIGASPNYMMKYRTIFGI